MLIFQVSSVFHTCVYGYIHSEKGTDATIRNNTAYRQYILIWKKIKSLELLGPVLGSKSHLEI